MSIFDILTLFGGLAMFLYGMRLMGDGLKESSSGALKKAMESVTNNPVKAFLLGLGVTAIIQSSTATIVITSGLVAAGLLTLHQSLGIIIGANVGTTVTGQIIRLLDLDSSGGTSWLQIFKPSSLAPIALIIGIIVIMGGRFWNSRQDGVRRGRVAVYGPWKQSDPGICDRCGRSFRSAEFLCDDRYPAGVFRVRQADI